MIPLDYKIPESPKPIRPILPVSRFGGGLAIGFVLAELLMLRQNPRGDADACCDSIGFVLTILIWCGLFLLGMMIRSRGTVMRLRERHILLTIAVGAGMFGTFAIAGTLLDPIVGPGRDVWVLLPAAFGLPVLCAWPVFGLERAV